MRMRLHNLLIALLLAVCWQSWGAHRAAGQILTGHWVDQQNERIEQHRKSNVRLIVLDAQGRPVPAAQIHVAMQRHAFSFGVRLDPALLAEKDDDASPGAGALWPLLSSVAIEEPARWLSLEPKQGQLDWSQVDDMLTWAARKNLRVRWGPVISNDLSRLPVWLTKLQGDELASALQSHVQDVHAHLAGRAVSWDVITRLPDHAFVSSTLGEAMHRRLIAQAHMLSPKTARGIRFDDALGGQRLTDAVNKLSSLRDAQTPISHVSMDVKLGGSVAYVSLERSLDWLSQLNLGIQFVNLEVGGASPQTAAINLETTLRSFFAQPRVEGIWLAGLTPDELLDPSAALIDAQGRLTPAGRLFVNLVGTQWWTDEIIQADELGNARLRVFAGDYHIDARWAGGQASTRVRIEPGRHTTLVIVQQLKPAAASQ